MGPLNVFVYGGGPASAVVTDYLDASFKRVGSVSRQSLISAMNGPSGACIEPKSSPPPAAVRQLTADLRGSLPDNLASYVPESGVVIMDLFDERFGVDLLEDGSYITRSPDRVKYVRTGSRQYRSIAFGTDEHFGLWSAAADRFVGLLARTGLLPVTYLLDIPWAPKDEYGESAELPFGLPSAKANTVFARYVDYLCQRGIQVVSHAEPCASRHHRWGRAPYNFHDKVYHSVAGKLNEALRGPDGSGAEGHRLNWDERHRADILRWTSIEQFDANRQGRFHHVVAAHGAGQEYPLRCLVQNNNSDTLLVISHGALPRRKYTLPRFEWLASLEGRTENLMFLSDTALEPFDELELAWFTGNAQDDLTARYADMVSRAAEQLGVAKILFMGGSGGGFASLALASLCPGSRALVFNPQTQIRKYWNKPVRQYVDLLFPEFDSVNRLGKLGVRTDVVARYASAPLKNQVIYVQNDDDAHHVENHLQPFIELFAMNSRSGISEDGSIRLIVERFAAGHNMPYRMVLNPFVDLALANWGASLDLGPLAPEDAAIRQIVDEINAEADPGA